MFVDASAIVAILIAEAEAGALADLLDAAPSPISSPIAVFEAVLGICRERHARVSEDVREFFRTAGVRTVAISETEAERGWMRLPGVAKPAAIRPNSTRETASLTRSRKTTAPCCCSKRP